ncbi:AraC family transcriptional regulator [uncultured Amphritea sp.]|uniref:AraC family transcriptional regulator n=1 Tax=uncultured Amphritea sp. TaxID=981605 RepID=UPI0026034314|nr:AraC family transcriptional regulator [uncultured Amphritea sp.]
MNKNNIQRIQPEFELVEQPGGESIRYLEHGIPSPLVRWHYHEEYELHLIRESSGKVFIGNYIGNFTPNSLILVGPNLPHNWISQIDKEESIALRDQVINFSEGFIQNSERTFPELKQLHPFWNRATHGIEFLNATEIPQAIALFEEIARSTGFRRLTRFWVLIELLAAMKEYRVLSSSSFKPLMDKKTLNRLNVAINYIFDHYDTEVTLEEVADKLKMSPTYFSRFFKKSTGHRFIEFVNGLRVNKACELLAHSDEPITEICFTVGFNNIANFNRRFSDIKSMTPSEYRKTSLDALYKS